MIFYTHQSTASKYINLLSISYKIFSEVDHILFQSYMGENAKKNSYLPF